MKRTLSKWMLSLVVGLLALVPSMMIPRARADSSSVSIATISNPCTDQESWDYSPIVSQAWRGRFSAVKPGAINTDLVAFASAKVLRDRSRNLDFKALGEYQMGRVLFDLRLPHLAYEEFTAMLARNSRGAGGLRLAALQCLDRIQKQTPSLILPSTSVQALKQAPIASMSDDDKARFLTMLVAFCEKQFTHPGSHIDDALALLKDSGPYESYVLALRAANTGDSQGAAANAEKFLSYGDNLPQSLQSRADAVRVLLGQIDYDAGKYDAAAQAFRAVDSDSNYLSQALTDLAWSLLLQKRDAAAMGAARNLLMGGLRRAFAPEANLITAIAFLKTCHYPEALKSVKLLQKNYWHSYNWLYHWSKDPHSGETSYTQLAQYLNQGKSLKTIPVNVASEWARSPVFIQSQEELNSIYDERDAMKPLLPHVEHFSKSHRGLSPALNFLANRMQAETVSNHGREVALLAAINSDLMLRGKAMLINIADVWGNSQLVEVDTFNQLGDKMMADNFSAKYRKITENKKAHKDDAPTWDWGRVPATDQESGEVWEDEVGFLQVGLENRCTKH